jgi:hypothetical protein
MPTLDDLHREALRLVAEAKAQQEKAAELFWSAVTLRASPAASADALARLGEEVAAHAAAAAALKVRLAAAWEALLPSLRVP